MGTWRPVVGILGLLWVLLILGSNLLLTAPGEDPIPYSRLTLPPADNKDVLPLRAILIPLYFGIGLLGAPLGVIAGLGWLKGRGTRPLVWGTAAGAAAGLWVSSLLVSMPYLGAYPSLPAILVVMTMAQSLKIPWHIERMYLPIVMIDVVMGTLFGLLFGWLTTPSRRVRED